MENVELIRNAIKQSIPQLSINCVIFRFYHQKLQIPVVQPLSSEVRVIPGGYIYQNEGIDEAARRIVYEQTQIEEPFLNQFGSFGAASRDFEKEFQSISNVQIPTDILQWLSQRFVTIGYYSIVGNQEVEVKTNLFFKNVEWMDVDKAESLALDHSLLLSEAKKVMARDLLSQPLLMNFFPDVFTLPELQKLYEAILGRPVDRGNFRQRILKSKSIVKTGKTKENSKRRPPDLYTIDKEYYLKSLNEEIKLGF